MEQFLAYVAVENVAYHFDILYAYLIPEKLLSDAAVGMRVQIPFGRGSSQRQGIIFSISPLEKEGRYKSVTKLLDKEPILNDEMIKIAHFLKERTFCTYYEGAKIQMPTGFNLKMQVTYVAIKKESEVSLSKKEQHVYDYMLEKVSYLEKDAILSECQLPKDSDILAHLVSKGVVLRNYDTSAKVGNLSVKTAVICADEEALEEITPKLTQKQKSVLNVLKEVGSASVKEICYFTGVSAAVISNLEKKGIIKIFDADVFRTPKQLSIDENAKKEIVLTNEQTTAYTNLYNKYTSGGGVSLLYGVTGSGKTSVFMKLIDKVLSDGKQVIVMVPEISLTPQLLSLFKGRYSDKVAIFHSGLSMGERKDEYRRVKEGKASIAVGTRSAVFAPFDNLGLIVIDEEQEHTYKSEAAPRFHARDVAKFRVAYHKALLLLASATPSIETYSMAKRGTYSLECLSNRYGSAVLPTVSVVDMKEDRRKGNKYSISLDLQNAISQNLENHKQTILLMNRRGYNTFAACDDCGNVITCPSCSISLTFHSANGRLMCHYCGYSTEFTNKCSKCGKNHVRYAGYGTQRVEEEIHSLFPSAKVLRLDADSSSSRYSFENSLLKFSKGEYDIMLGTQMVAKGLNFENVTVVGVINSDSQLSSDDYKSEELTFDLLTQVVGRSGRGQSKGMALIQTMSPENSIIRLAQNQDYDSFYNNEIVIRKCLIYPPFCDICTVTAIGENEFKTLSASKSFLARLSELADEKYKQLKLIVLPPMPPKIAKVNNKYRFRIIIKCKNNKLFRSLISQLLCEFGKCKTYSDIAFVADINPES